MVLFIFKFLYSQNGKKLKSYYLALEDGHYPWALQNTENFCGSYVLTIQCKINQVDHLSNISQSCTSE